MVSGDVLNMKLYMEAKLLPNTISRNTVAELVGTSQPDKVSKFFWSGFYSRNLNQKQKLISTLDVLIAKHCDMFKQTLTLKSIFFKDCLIVVDFIYIIYSSKRVV